MYLSRKSWVLIGTSKGGSTLHAGSQSSEASGFYTRTSPTYIQQQRDTGQNRKRNGSKIMAVDKKVLKTCVVCKRKFLGWFSEKYCSDDCRIEGTRLKNRNRQRKSRKVLDLREGAISQQLGELGLGDTQYPMYNHELVTTMYANLNLYHGRDGKRHVRSYYDLLREIAKLNGGDTSKILSRLAPREQN